MARLERFANNATTTLSSAINASVTSISVADASPFPTDGDFRIIIDNELLLVTGVSGTTFTVERGVEGSTADSHNSSVVVVHIATSDGMQQYITQNGLPLFGTSSRKPNTFRDKSGNKLTVASFTGANLGTSTAWDYTDAHGIGFHVQANTVNSARVWYKSAPTPPWTLTSWFGVTGKAGSGSQIFIGCKESGPTGSLSLMVTRITDVVHHNWTSPTAFSASQNISGFQGQPLGHWFQVEDDNVNIYFRCSHDGVFWTTIYQEARLNFLSSVDELCFGGNDSLNEIGVFGQLWSWVEE